MRVRRRHVGTTPEQLRALAAWLVEGEVEEVVMESTAQYWRPVWEALRAAMATDATRPRGRRAARPVHCISRRPSRTKGPRGRKQDFPDAERLVKRLVAHELTLSFVPDVIQRLWRTVTRRKYQFTCNRVQLQNRLECLLEEAHIKVSSLVSDLLGLSGRRMLRAVASGETDPSDRRRARQSTAACDARSVPRRARRCTDLNPLYRRLLAMTLDELGCDRGAHPATG